MIYLTIWYCFSHCVTREWQDHPKLDLESFWWKLLWSYFIYTRVLYIICTRFACIYICCLNNWRCDKRKTNYFKLKIVMFNRHYLRTSHTALVHLFHFLSKYNIFLFFRIFHSFYCIVLHFISVYLQGIFS